jgi:hypothetical protein
MERIRRSWPWSGLGIELYGDLGGNFGLNSPRLANFGQTLERSPGLYGSGGIVLIVPIPGDSPGLSGLHLRTGGQVLHSASETTRVNNDAGGFLRTRGHHNTTAAFGTLGFGLGPFDGTGALGRIRFTFDGGLGRAFHDVSAFGPGGNQVISSNDSSLAWMVRGAAIYQVTDYVGIGAFVSHFRTDGVTAFLANGNPFALGGRSETAAGITLVLRAMRASSTYANVHTDRFPGGEIRGQIRFTPE